ncbi:ABC transporter substrate-binding protein [Streptomyces sp. NBC_00057]|uniref:ABC transporter substrate-binding protein n=1 Tax=Streptomyces sp. NBC_00057 TaxID=2975634 RepID=UPI00386F2F7F
MCSPTWPSRVGQDHHRHPNADATGWTLQLREGVKFSDGKPLDSQAVVDHVKRLTSRRVSAPAPPTRRPSAR